MPGWELRPRQPLAMAKKKKKIELTGLADCWEEEDRRRREEFGRCPYLSLSQLGGCGLIS